MDMRDMNDRRNALSDMTVLDKYKEAQATLDDVDHSQ